MIHPTVRHAAFGPVRVGRVFAGVVGGAKRYGNTRHAVRAKMRKGRRILDLGWRLSKRLPPYNITSDCDSLPLFTIP